MPWEKPSLCKPLKSTSTHVPIFLASIQIFIAEKKTTKVDRNLDPAFEHVQIYGGLKQIL
jgi:hypothetical protein